MSVRPYCVCLCGVCVCVCVCVCVWGGGPSDIAILTIMLTALMCLRQMCLLCLLFSCFSAAVRSDPITFGHVELNAGSD